MLHRRDGLDLAMHGILTHKLERLTNRIDLKSIELGHQELRLLAGKIACYGKLDSSRRH
jgi:hypothetical protein